MAVDASLELLVTRCAGGDAEALGALYDRFGPVAYGLARRITGDDARAEDVVEAAFLEAWRAAGSFDAARQRVSTWLLTIVHRHALAARRGRAALAPAAQSPGAGPAPVALEPEAARAALAQLEPSARRVLELAYLDGCSQAEIAEILGEPADAVGGMLHAAVMALRDNLGAVRG